MAWVSIMCPEGPYQMNPEGVTRIIRSYAYAKAVAENTTVKREFQWFGPTVAIATTDWQAVHKQRDRIILQMGDDFYLRMSRKMTGKDGIAYLEGLIDERDDYTDSVAELQRKATKESMHNIATAIEIGEGGVETAKFIRNTAAETELVLVSLAATGGVGLVSGTAKVLAFTEGASTGAIGATGIIAGSLGKGAIKWQDTGSVGKAVAESSIELVINTLSFGMKGAMDSIAKRAGKAAASKAEKIVVGLIFGKIKGALKMGAAAYVSPEEVAKGKEKSLAELLLPALANMPSAIAGDLVKEITKDPRLTIPATILLKLGLKYGADAIAKPGAAKPVSMVPFGANQMAFTPLNRATMGLIQAAKPTSVPTGAALSAGRQALHSTHSRCIFDSARPSDAVMDSALRPIASM